MCLQYSGEIIDTKFVLHTHHVITQLINNNNKKIFGSSKSNKLKENITFLNCQHLCDHLKPISSVI